MNVLSLFDGLSGGRIALERAGIPVTNYYASEIDKYAQIVSEANYPDIIRLGDVTGWHNWDTETPDLIIAGSPCQGFSFAGKQLNFDDPRSSLFFEFVDILHHYQEVNPDVKFMLENVNMKQEYLDLITQMLGVEPIKINSSLVSAQNRVRWYWTNIEGIEQPEDKNIELPDILEELAGDSLGARITNRRINDLGKRDDYNQEIPLASYLEVKNNCKANCLTTIHYDSVVAYYKTDRLFKVKKQQNKASCLTGGHRGDGNHSDMDILVIEPNIVRRYSLVEEERLQTIPDNYTNHVSNTQRHKMIANGWTVDVIAHIFRNIK